MSERPSERPARSSGEKLTPFQLGLINKFYHYPIIASRRVLPEWRRFIDEYEECVASGYVGLVEASTRFDKAQLEQPGVTNGGAFIYRCVFNHIHNGYRSRNYQETEGRRRIPKPSVILATATSMDIPRYGSDGGIMYSIGETIPSPGNLEEEAVERLALQSLASNIRDKLSRLNLTLDQHEIFQRLEQGESHRTIAANMGRSQNFVSSNIRRITQAIVEELGANPPELS